MLETYGKGARCRLGGGEGGRVPWPGNRDGLGKGTGFLSMDGGGVCRHAKET